MTENHSSGRVPPLESGERLDDLQRGGYFIIQKPSRFCFGMDAVLLADYAAVRPGDRILDLGCGNGIIPLLMHARLKEKGSCSFTGLEINEESAGMARRSVCFNHTEDDISIICGDIREADRIFPAASFDVITSNPPYMIADHGLKNADPGKAAARHELLCTLEDVARQSSRLLRQGGKCYLVHRPFRLAEIIRALSAFHLEPKRMRLVHPYADREPNLVLLEAVKGGRPRMSVEKPLIVYEADGSYTEEVLKIYGKET